MQSTKLLNPKAATKAAAAVTNTMPNELPPQKSSASSILDKFRSLLKLRQQSAAGEGRVLNTGDMVDIYETVLNELTFNSKPIITDLTIVAGELREHGEGIADALCARIIEIALSRTSVVNTLGIFSSRLPEVFCEAYGQVDPSLYPSMRHLFGTWSTVFPSSVLRKIDTQLQFSSQSNNHSSSLTSLKASESPRPSHGIHVNPKYLRQMDSSRDNCFETEILMAKDGLMMLNISVGTSSNLKIYGHKPAVGYDEYKTDQAEVISSQVGVSSASLTLGSNKLQPSSTSRLARCLSPSTTGAERPSSSEIDDFAAGNSPRRFVEGLSPSHTPSDYGHGRVAVRDDETNELRRKHYSDDNHYRFEASARYSLSNGREQQGPRALIDAYGG
ncbi:hypothetical protein OIU78_024461 [Salix suchowensis]|nr:hypothetical protein OIU78_024461 [Salix suchowensis]